MHKLCREQEWGRNRQGSGSDSSGSGLGVLECRARVSVVVVCIWILSSDLPQWLKLLRYSWSGLEWQSWVFFVCYNVVYPMTWNESQVTQKYRLLRVKTIKWSLCDVLFRNYGQDKFFQTWYIHTRSIQVLQQSNSTRLDTGEKLCKIVKVCK